MTLALLGTTGWARSEPTATPSPDPSPGHRTLASGASLLPGVLLHGSGHFALGRQRTAGRLFAAEGLGLAMFLIGGGTLVGTGANRYLTGPAAGLGIAGIGLFSSSWLADVIGTAWPRHARGEPITRRPLVELELGYRAVHDLQFAYAHLLYHRLDLQRWGWRLSPSMWLALDDENARMRLEAAYRPWGPRSEVDAADGSYVELRTAVTHHRFAPEGFRTLTTELAARGRVDLWRFDADLAGQYAELELGVALQSFDYDRPALSLGTDNETLLLTRIAHGVYVGHPQHPWADVQVFYDHRHDTYVGGLNGFAIGAPGFFGAQTRIYPLPQLGIRGEVALGSAVYGGVSLLTRLITPEDAEP